VAERWTLLAAWRRVLPDRHAAGRFTAGGASATDHPCARGTARHSGGCRVARGGPGHVRARRSAVGDDAVRRSRRVGETLGYTRALLG